jgi:hypothetical protein
MILALYILTRSMSTTSRHSVIYELLDEIRNLRDTELYIQHRILTKQKVIYELMEGLSITEVEQSILKSEDIFEKTALPPFKIKTIPDGCKLSATQIFKDFLLNGSYFEPFDTKKLINKYAPELKGKDRKLLYKGIYQCIFFALYKKTIRRIPGGYAKTISEDEVNKELKATDESSDIKS